MTQEPCFEPAWLHGWQRSSQGWKLEAVGGKRGAWETRLLPAAWLQERRRLFEPSAPPYTRLPTTTTKLHIDDLSRLSPLVEPGELLKSFIPGAAQTRHAVYAAAQGDSRFFVPAALLLAVLWAWTANALQALLTPNSLALFLGRSEGDGHFTVDASGLLARLGTSDTTLRRLCWLAQCSDAQASWSSVLTHAHDGAIRLELPSASFEAWVRGVQLPTGLLVSELWATHLSFELPRPQCRVSLGGTTLVCPPAPKRQTGLVSF